MAFLRILESQGGCGRDAANPYRLKKKYELYYRMENSIDLWTYLTTIVSHIGMMQLFVPMILCQLMDCLDLGTPVPRKWGKMQ
jgi:hypothetical protein